MKIKAYELKDLVEKKIYSAYLVYGQNKGLVREKSKMISIFLIIKLSYAGLSKFQVIYDRV